MNKNMTLQERINVFRTTDKFKTALPVLRTSTTAASWQVNTNIPNLNLIISNIYILWLTNTSVQVQY